MKLTLINKIKKDNKFKILKVLLLKYNFKRKNKKNQFKIKKIKKQFKKYNFLKLFKNLLI